MEKRNKMLVLNCETLEFEVKELPSEKVGYEVLSEAVGGYIEHVVYDRDFANRRIDMWIDEEGKLKGLNPCVAIVDENSVMMDILVGNVVFTTCDVEGDSFGLTDEEIGFIKTKFGTAYMRNATNLEEVREIKRFVFNL